MSWSANVASVRGDEVYDAFIDNFKKNYPTPAEGVTEQARAVANFAEGCAADFASQLGKHNEDLLFNVSANGHAQQEGDTTKSTVTVTVSHVGDVEVAAEPEAAAAEAEA